MTIRKAVLLLGILILSFQPSVRSEPRSAFEITLADDSPFHLSLEIHFMHRDHDFSYGPPPHPICLDCPFEADLFSVIYEEQMASFISYFYYAYSN
jgi:hypothetical protein